MREKKKNADAAAAAATARPPFSKIIKITCAPWGWTFVLWWKSLEEKMWSRARERRGVEKRRGVSFFFFSSFSFFSLSLAQLKENNTTHACGAIRIKTGWMLTPENLGRGRVETRKEKRVRKEKSRCFLLCFLFCFSADRNK